MTTWKQLAERARPMVGAWETSRERPPSTLEAVTWLADFDRLCKQEECGHLVEGAALDFNMNSGRIARVKLRRVDVRWDRSTERTSYGLARFRHYIETGEVMVLSCPACGMREGGTHGSK